MEKLVFCFWAFLGFCVFGAVCCGFYKLHPAAIIIPIVIAGVGVGLRGWEIERAFNRAFRR